jgi:hypothetical protein
MRFNIWTSSLTALIIPTLIGVIGCTSPDRDNDSEHAGAEEQAGHLPSHDEGGGEGEESGLQLAKNQTHDQVRNGARLTLRYDAQTHTFVGTVENITNQTLNNVRVEVHLSNGAVDTPIRCENAHFRWNGGKYNQPNFGKGAR